MNRLRKSWCALCCGAALVAFVSTLGLSTACAQTPDAKADTLRPEISTIAKSADEMIKAKKFQEAVLLLGQADGIADRTPYENYVLDRLRSAAAAGAGDNATAVKSLEAVLASGRLPQPEQLKVVQAIAILYSQAADYPKAATWLTRYFKEGGTDPQLRPLLIRALFLSENYAGAAKELRDVVEASEKAGTPPPLEQVQMLASSYAKLNDSTGYEYALGKLLAYYPRKEYWGDAIHRAETKPGFADYLALDSLRLQQATDSLSTAAQYTAMAQLALKIGLPAEAKKIVEQGYAKGVLGTGPDADLQKRLRDSAVKQAADDEKLLVQNAKDAGNAKDGVLLINTGFALVFAGQYDRGIALMEQGIARGNVAKPDMTKLHLGIAYLAAGQKAKAIETFKTVQGDDGSAELARLWVIHAQRAAG